MATTSTKLIVYPTSSDYIAPLETHFANLANSVETALTTKISATEITTGTLAIANGGTGATTAAAALINLGLSGYGDVRAGKNNIINGAFDIWQRLDGTGGTTSISTTGYLADRWRYVASTGAGKVISQSQQAFTAGTAPVSGYESKYFYRIAIAATAGSGYTYEALEQPIEDVRTFANTTVTLSFWAKSSTTSLVTPKLTQNFGTGGSTSIDITGSAITLTNTWTRYTQTLSVPSIATKTITSNSALIFALTFPINTLYTVDVWGVQVEQSSSATSFTTATETIGGELALCQRYYYRMSNSSTSTSYFASGMQFSSTTAYAYIKFPQQMRAAPSALETSGTLNVVCTAGVTSTSTAFGSANLDGVYIQLSATGTAGQGALVRFTGTVNTAYVGFSAEI
jgi:hypothetical protein